MKRKLIILGIIIFLTTGCSVEYNLEIDKDKFKESFSINAEVDSMSTKEDLYSNYLEEYPIYSDDYEEFMYYEPYTKNDDYTYYTKNYQELDNGYIFNYKASFADYKDYNKARSLNYIFKTGSVGYIQDKNNYYISVSNPKFVNLGIDSLKVNINFKNIEVLTNNATSVTGNIYTWNFDKNSTSGINVTYKLKNSSGINSNNPSSNPNNSNNDTNPTNPSNNKDNNNANKNEEEEGNSFYDYILVGTVILLFIVGIIGIIKYKSINNYE